MKFWQFMTLILVGIILEYVLRVVFAGYPVILVPELLIFLSVIDFGSKDLLIKFTSSAIIYDLWISPQIGLITLALLVMFLILYFLGRISYLDSSQIRRKFSYVSILALALLSEFLFLVYYLLIYLTDKLYLASYTIWQTGWSWRLSFWSNLITVCVVTTGVSLLLYLSFSFFIRPKRFKL